MEGVKPQLYDHELEDGWLLLGNVGSTTSEGARPNTMFLPQVFPFPLPLITISSLLSRQLKMGREPRPPQLMKLITMMSLRCGISDGGMIRLHLNGWVNLRNEFIIERVALYAILSLFVFQSLAPASCLHLSPSGHEMTSLVTRCRKCSKQNSSSDTALPPEILQSPQLWK